MLLIVGGVFVVEALSVIAPGGLLQAAPASGSSAWRRSTTTSSSKGWPEPKIIVRFWIVSIICALLALATLKLR